MVEPPALPVVCIPGKDPPGDVASSIQLQLSSMHPTISSTQPFDFLLPHPHSGRGTSKCVSHLPQEYPHRLQAAGQHSHFQADLLKERNQSGLSTPPPDMTGASLHYLPPLKHAQSSKAAVRDGATHAITAPSTDVSLSFSNVNGSTQLTGPTLTEDPRNRPLSPVSRRSSQNAPDQSKRRKNSTNTILASLQIPSSINGSKGSLAEFAAQITCLFWFESSFVLHRVEESRSPPVPATPLVSDAIPSLGFRKWVTTILSTTQVTQNVILLALMFVYRLKKLNPTVKGKSGSEYRLLTVALMLGNKFLDDNTYTNKTWAEVSGISVQEIHIMEVEFLSNMRYSLFTTETEWADWHVKLSRFWDYFDRALRTPHEAHSRQAAPPTPSMTLLSSLPSPPSSNHASPPYMASHSPSHSFPHSLSVPAHLTPSTLSPIAALPDLDLGPGSRKRSYDGSDVEPPPKRALRSNTSLVSVSQHGIPNLSYTSGTVPRLPVPHIQGSSTPSSNGYSTPISARLPPPSGRAMSMAFGPSTTTVWTQSGHPSGVQAPSHPTTHTTSLSPYGDQPQLQGTCPPSLKSSPGAGHYPHPQSQAHSSPSFFLTNRNSPYRPVRGVSTLLVPPPSGAVHHAPLNLGFHQMHYQPLGKSLHEARPGVVPFMPYDSYQHLQPPVTGIPLSLPDLGP